MKTVIGSMMVGAVLTLGGCQRPEALQHPAEPELTQIPAHFSFATDQDITFRITALTNRNTPMNGVPFSVYSVPDGDLLVSGVTTAGGVFETKHRLATHYKQVEIRTSYPGIPNSQVVTLAGTTVAATFGGTSPNGRVSAEASVTAGITNTRIPNLKTLGSWNNAGLPTYLVSNNPDAIEQKFYEDIAASLPESRPLTQTHPDYLTGTAPATIHLTE